MYENFIAEGDKVVVELLSKGYFDVEMIVATESWINEHSIILEQYRPLTYSILNEQMEQISLLKSPKEVLMIAKKKIKTLADVWKPNFKAFYLDGIQDPGNVGTIIRIADWFGFDAVIKNENSADFFNPKVVQASMGSLNGPALIEANYEILQPFDLHYYAMDMQGNDIQTMVFNNPCIVVLGNEGQGISAETKQIIANQHFVHIAGHASKSAESLNVSVVAGIVAQKIFYQGNG